MNYIFLISVSLNILVGIVASTKDYYETLQVKSSATLKEIKQGFRKKALLYHPDKNPEADPSIFMEIKEAYEVLSDKKKRKMYDQLGHARFVNEQANGSNGGGGTHHFHTGHHAFKFNFDSFDDIFKNFDDDDDDFGFAFNGHHFRANHHQHATFNSFGEEFLNLDEMFGDFGSQDSFFGHFDSQDSLFGHFQHSDHMKRHHEAHNNARAHAHHQSTFAQAHTTHQAGRSCKTVTQQVGGMVTQYTKCT